MILIKKFAYRLCLRFLIDTILLKIKCLNVDKNVSNIEQTHADENRPFPLRIVLRCAFLCSSVSI